MVILEGELTTADSAQMGFGLVLEVQLGVTGEPAEYKARLVN